jgi:hypothetical protein
VKARQRKNLWLMALLPTSLGLGFIFLLMPFEEVGRPLVVASGKLACGEVLLTQSFTGTSDPYFVLFYFRANGAHEWVEFYVDDESPYWRGSLRVSQDSNSCSVTFYWAEKLSYRCGERSLARSRRTPTLPRALVADPLARDYRQRVKPKAIGAQLDSYWTRSRSTR